MWPSRRQLRCEEIVGNVVEQTLDEVGGSVLLLTNWWTVLIPGGTGDGACGIAAGATGTPVTSGEETGDLHSSEGQVNLFDPELFDEGTVIETDEDPTVLVKNTGQTVRTDAPLTSVVEKRAQQFTTGANTCGYTLSSIGIDFSTIGDTSTAGSQLIVTLNAVSSGKPGSVLCTLTDPTGFTANAVNTFDAPATGCPLLTRNTTYFVVIERVNSTADTIALNSTNKPDEDTGGAAGWSIANDRLNFIDLWTKLTGTPHLIEVRGAALPSPLVKNTGQTATANVDLNSTVSKRAQAFTTGANTGGYTLSSIGFDFNTIASTSTADDHLKVTLNADSSGNPGDALCTLTDPTSFTANAVNTFDAPETGCPTLAASTTYFAVIERVTSTSGTISFNVTNSIILDTGGAVGWSMARGRQYYDTAWNSILGIAHLIDVQGIVLPPPPPPVVTPPVVETDEERVLVKNTGQTADSTALQLDSTNSKRAQQFTTGTSSNRYTLRSIGIDFGSIFVIATAGTELTVMVNEDDNGNPGNALCTLGDPATFTSSGVQAFDAPATCPTLAPSTTYFVVIDRVTVGPGAISLSITSSSAEDTGGAVGWSIGNDRHYLQSGSWNTVATKSHQIEVSGDLFVPPLPDGALVGNTGQLATGFGASLTSTVTMRAQAFTTGADADAFGYKLSPIGIMFHTIADTSTAGDHLRVTLNTVNARGSLASPLCALRDPAPFTGSGVQTFDARTCPLLSKSTTYFVNVERVDADANTISLNVTSSPKEDPGGAAGWSISNHRCLLEGSDLYTIFSTVTSESYMIEVSGAAVPLPGRNLPEEEFNTLKDAGQRLPGGLWSDGTTMWVTERKTLADPTGFKIYAYDLATKARVPDEDFNTLASNNSLPNGIWSDGTTMWVTNSSGSHVFAYDMITKARVTGKEFTGPEFNDHMTVGHEEARHEGIWADGEIMWIAHEDGTQWSAYLLETLRSRSRHNFYNNDKPQQTESNGMWGDDQTIWVVDSPSRSVRAYWKRFGLPQPGRNIELLHTGEFYDYSNNDRAYGIWSDGTTMWVSDYGQDKIYAYTLPPAEIPLVLKGRVSVERVTDTTVMVAVDLRGSYRFLERAPRCRSRSTLAVQPYTPTVTQERPDSCCEAWSRKPNTPSAGVSR